MTDKYNAKEKRKRRKQKVRRKKARVQQSITKAREGKS